MAVAMVLRAAAAAALLLAAVPLLRLGHAVAFVAPRAIASPQATPTAKPWGLQSQGQRVAKIPRHSGTQQATVSSSVTPAVLVLGLIFGSAALLRVGYTPLVQEVLCFRSKGHELLFAIFTACSILWFLSPSHLAERVARPLRPLALRFASQGQTRLSAVTLAASDLLRYVATASQAFFAACLVMQALPAQARYLLPFIPRNAAFITGTGATKIMGPWMGRPAALGGWMMELMGILISHKTFLLLTALSAFPTYRFVWRALEPSPIPEGETRGAGGQLVRELLRSCLSGAVLAGGVRAGFAAAGRSLPDAALLPVLAFIALAGVQPVQDLAARAFAALHLRAIKKKRLRGMLGGKMVNGSLQGFSGLAAQVATKDLLAGVEVPVNGVAKGIEAAEEALSSGSRKKKLLAIPLLLAFGTLLWKVPSAGSFAYGLGVSMYLSAFVLPPPLIVILALVILIFGGPAPSLSSKGFALGLGLSALKQLLAGRAQPSLVTCDGLILEKGEATIAWRTTSAVPAEEVAQQVRDAAAGDQDGESLKKLGKKLRIKAVALSVVAALLILVMCRWPSLVEWVEHNAPTSGHRLLILGMSSGIALRLMNFEVLQQGARRVLPARLAGASGGPGKAAHWFLAVNTRASAVSAATAFFIPMVGIAQKIAYHLELKKEVAWVDAWALQISTAFVFLVLSVQAARVLSRSLPTASSPAPGLALACVRAWIVGAASTAIYGTILLAVGAPGPMSPGLLGGAVGSCLAAGVAAGSLALAYFLAQDWLTRLYVRTGRLFWLRATDQTSQPFKLQRFEGRHALLTPLKSGEELKVPASQLGGSQRGTVRPVRIAIPIGEDTKADMIADHVRSAIKQQDGLLHQQSLQPKVCVAEDGRVICVDAFLEGSAPLDK
ncbi:unnamed protein product, partial [Symbiodinium microadriaticum]